ncbi:MAG: hypothetical protein OEZ13_04425 [Spirochaetia bacterium]|nr:hypothetical protein [Spirochaetia bacterium]
MADEYYNNRKIYISRQVFWQKKLVISASPIMKQPTLTVFPIEKEFYDLILRLEND